MDDLQIVFCGDWATEVRDVMRRLVPPGFRGVFLAETAPSQQDELLAQADFLLCSQTVVTEDTFKKAPRLRMIQKWGIGVDMLDLKAADRHGVFIYKQAGINSNAVAEHTIMFMLAASRWLSLADRSMRDGRWLFKEMRAQCQQLKDKTVGIVGLGHIGRAVAHKLTVFGTRTVYYDPVRPGADIERTLAVEYLPLDELLAQADIVTLHCPGGVENRNMMGAERIAKIKRGGILINAARGEIVNESALIAALRDGHLAAAALDVYEPEPPAPDSPLFSLDNVVFTPHTAASVFDNVENVVNHALRNIVDFAQGRPLSADDAVVLPKTPRVFTTH
jgi:phosphoglycerate dehydrogenase-like enzyme